MGLGGTATIFRTGPVKVCSAMGADVAEPAQKRDAEKINLSLFRVPCYPSGKARNGHITPPVSRGKTHDFCWITIFRAAVFSVVCDHEIDYVVQGDSEHVSSAVHFNDWGYHGNG